MLRGYELFVAALVGLLVCLEAAPTKARDYLTEEDKVQSGQTFLYRRFSSAQICQVISLLPNDKIKIGFRGSASSTEIVVKTDLERFIPVKSSEKLIVGDEYYYNKGGKFEEVHDVIVSEIFPNGRVRISYPGYSSAWDEMVPRSLLGWGSAQARKEAATAAAEAAAFRTWTDITGKHKTQAKFIAQKDGKVTLEKKDGKRVELKLEALSEADRKYVDSVTAENPFAADENPFEKQDENPFEAAEKNK